jgi:isopentenyldiphosphate isomerase
MDLFNEISFKTSKLITQKYSTSFSIGISNFLPRVKAKEAAEYKYINYKNLVNDIKQNPINYTIWFRKIYERLHIIKQKEFDIAFIFYLV